MKIKHIFFALVAVIGLFSACSEEEMTVLDSVQVTKSYITFDANGGSDKTVVTAKGAWTISDVPEWITVSPASGQAGETEVTFSAPAATASRTATLSLQVDGQTEFQRINVLQQTEKVELPISTCATVLKGPDSDTYRVKGSVTKIVNTTYGNWYLADETGEVYIYGTLDANGGEKNFTSLGIEVGDIVTCEGPKTTYNGVVELVNVSVVAIEKSLMKVDSLSVETLPKEGGEFIAYLTCKGSNVNVEAAEDWVSVKTIKSLGNNLYEVYFKVGANDGGARSSELTFQTQANGKTYTSTSTIAQEGSIVDVNCATFNTLADDPNALYKVHGIVTKIANDTYGNYYINDGTGEVYVYGTLDANGNTKNFSSLGITVGDEVVLQSIKTSYNGTNQMKNAVVVSHTAHDVKTVAELQGLEDDKNTYYLVTGTVFHLEGDAYKFDLETYGNFGLKDETGEIYVYGVADALDGVTKNFKATGIQEGDKVTLLAYKTSYKGNNQIVGKFIKKETAE